MATGGRRPGEPGETHVRVPAGKVWVEGDLAIPDEARGVVLFAHGSGSGRHSPRNRFVAETLRQRRLATLLADLLTAEEERIDLETRRLRFDIELLAERVAAAAAWLGENPATRGMRIGLFGASTGAAAALAAAARHPENIWAIVSRGGRPDLAEKELGRVMAPTLLIVGGYDEAVIKLNEEAYRLLRVAKSMHIVPGATHLFEEPGALEEVAELAGNWFERWV